MSYLSREYEIFSHVLRIQETREYAPDQVWQTHRMGVDTKQYHYNENPGFLHAHNNRPLFRFHSTKTVLLIVAPHNRTLMGMM